MESKNKEIKELLKSTLPYGSNAEIKRLMLEKKGEIVSASHIGKKLYILIINPVKVVLFTIYQRIDREKLIWFI